MTALQVTATLCILISCNLKLISSQCDLTCENTGDDDIADIVEQMTDNGYSVMSGQFELYDPETSNVYIPFARPPGDDDVETKYLVSVFEDGDTSYRFGPQDAIVWRGCTPQTVKYFGWRAFAAETILQQDINGNPTDLNVLRASLGDSMNQLVINTESNDDTLFPSPFDRKTNIVTTGDGQTWTDIMNSYVNADLLTNGYSLNLNAINSNLPFKYSVSELVLPRDELSIIIEIISDPDSSCDDALYFNQSFPFKVFYTDELDQRESINSTDRDLEAQNIAECETDPESENEDNFDVAVDEIIDYYENQIGYTFISNTPFDDSNGISVGDNGAVDLNIFGYGQACLESEVDCMYDNRDNFYRWTAEDYTMSNTDIYVIVGVNHNNFGSSVINSLTVSRVVNPDNGNIMEGVDSFINYENEKAGSELISNGVICDNNPSDCDDAFLENLFVVEVSRPNNCGNSDDSIFSMCLTNDILADDDSFIFFAEALLNTRTNTRPNEDCLIAWRLLQFSTTPKPTAAPTTAEPTTPEPTTAEPTTAEPTTVETATAEPTKKPKPKGPKGPKGSKRKKYRNRRGKKKRRRSNK